MPLVNVTTHAIKIMRPDGTPTVATPSGIVARVSVERRLSARQIACPFWAALRVL